MLFRSDRPARSTLEYCDFSFNHEFDCPRNGSSQDCTCYVSRIRLVTTPVGDMLPTTDPDLAPQLVFWERSARMWKRAAYICGSASSLSLILSVSNAMGWF